MLQQQFINIMTKIVIPVQGDLLSNSFNFCSYFLIYEIKDRQIVGKKIDFFPAQFKAKIDQWSGSGITDVIVHYIDEHSLSVLTSTKINLFVGVKISSPDALIEEFLNGTLKSNTYKMVERCRVDQTIH